MMTVEEMDAFVREIVDRVRANVYAGQSCDCCGSSVEGWDDAREDVRRFVETKITTKIP